MKNLFPPLVACCYCHDQATQRITLHGTGIAPLCVCDEHALEVKNAVRAGFELARARGFVGRGFVALPEERQ